MRRSLFTSEAERTQFLHHLVTGTRDVLRAQQGLAEHDNYHEFCRLLGRLKHNYQLSELVSCMALVLVTSVTDKPKGCLNASAIIASACFLLYKHEIWDFYL